MDSTHEVFNQPQPLVGYNLFESNRALQAALKFNAPQLSTTALTALGTTLGSAHMQMLARLANVNPPVLHTHDRFGRRVDEVEFHPSYHALMAAAIGAGLHSSKSGSPHPNPLPGGEETRAGKRFAPDADSLPLPYAGEGYGEGSPAASYADRHR